jgi:signal transduction histidine kinase
MQESISDHSAEQLLQLLLNIALRYINVPLELAGQTINHTLEEMGLFVNADRVYVFDYDFTINSCCNTFEWCASGISPEIENLQHNSLDDIPQWVEAHKSGLEMYISDVQALPDDEAIKQILAPQGIKSILTIPMVNGSELLGFVGFDSVRAYHCYTQQERTLLAVFAQLLVNIKLRLRTLNQLSAEKARAEKAAQVKNEFLANVSHELRTPLNAIIGFTDLLLNDKSATQSYLYLSKIKQASTLQLSLINDILDFSKFESDTLTLYPEQNSLCETVQQLDDLFARQAADKGLKLSFELDTKIPARLLFDQLRLTQVLTNLISNALKFTDKGYVKCQINLLGLSDSACRIKFGVKDTGIGIAPHSLNKICLAFSQADSSITRKYGGTGLGLAISSKLLKQMASLLNIESVLGEGSCFSFILDLPIAKQSSDQLRQEPGAALMSGITHYPSSKVLVAEDNSTNRLVIQKMLERFGLQVLLAEDGQQAIEQVALNKPNLVLMDLQMPIMDGFEATRLIKSQYPDLPVIALSAAVLDEDRALAKASGVDAHLAKPLKMVDLELLLQQWLSS